MTHGLSKILEPIHRALTGVLTGTVSEEEYVGTIRMNEMRLKRRVFHPNDVTFNFVSYHKFHDDGRESTGAYRLTHSEHPEYVDEGKQIHITLFESPTRGHIDLYAHYEYEWMRHPIRHLKTVDFSPHEGVVRTRRFLYDNNVDLFKER